MSGVNQSSGVLCRLEMPAWNGRAGSRPLREPAGAAGMGGAALVGILGISHCPLENDLYFTSFSFPSCEQLRSQSGYSRLSGFCDQNLRCDGVCMEDLDGMDSEVFWWVFLFFGFDFFFFCLF